MPEQEVNTEMEQPPEHTFDAIHDKGFQNFIKAFKLNYVC